MLIEILVDSLNLVRTRIPAVAIAGRHPAACGEPAIALGCSAHVQIDSGAYVEGHARMANRGNAEARCTQRQISHPKELETVFDNVFVGVDGRSGGREAIALAKQLVQPGGQLTLAHVYRTHRVLGRAAALLQPAEREASLELLGREREAASVQAKLVIDAASTVGLGLRQLAARHRADLLVVGSCHRGAPGRLFLGDDTRATLNGAPCPMAIAPGGYQPHELTDIGIGYDASPESHEALGAARELAARHGSTIRALSVVSLQSIPYGEPIPIGWPKFANGLVDDELKRSAQNEGVIGDATPGRPTKDLAEFANEVDLLIVGSRGYGPLGRLLNGSTSNYLARHACCPLLVLPRARPCNGRPGATSSEQDRGSNLLISRSDSLAQHETDERRRRGD